MPATRAHIRIAITALLALTSLCASAASFDCKKAKTKVEKAICASPELSQLDEQMAQRYEQARRALSADGAKELKASQQSWLRYFNRACNRPVGSGEDSAFHFNSCVASSLKERSRELDMAALRVGAMVLTRIDKYAVFAGQKGDTSGGHGGQVVHHVAYPKIDGATSEAVAWNIAQVKALPEPGNSIAGTYGDSRETSHDDAYLIGCASEQLLSIEHVFSTYPHGSAHGWYGSQVATTLLQPHVRMFQAGDLFAEGSGWETGLPQLFWQAYLRQKNADKDNGSAQRAIRERAADPAAWLLTPAGLRIAFNAYDGGSYAGTPGPITVTWAELKPLMGAKAAPVCVVSTLAPER